MRTTKYQKGPMFYLSLVKQQSSTNQPIKITFVFPVSDPEAFKIVLKSFGELVSGKLYFQLTQQISSAELATNRFSNLLGKTTHIRQWYFQLTQQISSAKLPIRESNIGRSE